MSVDAAAAEGRFAPLGRSPMEAQARAAGATFEARDGWNVAVTYGDPAAERAAIATAAAWTDSSHLGKLELQCEPEQAQAIVAHACEGIAPALEFGLASRAAGAWWCPLTPGRLLAICGPSRTPALRERLAEGAAAAPGLASVVEVTTLQGALTFNGPAVRELFARFCALDLRPQSTPVRGLRPGSFARTPGIVIREGEQRFLALFGWALGEYVWSVVEDAGRRLGARPAGVDALDEIDGEAAGA